VAWPEPPYRSEPEETKRSRRDISRDLLRGAGRSLWPAFVRRRVRQAKSVAAFSRRKGMPCGGRESGKQQGRRSAPALVGEPPCGSGGRRRRAWSAAARFRSGLL